MPTVNEIINRARATVGTEETLNGVITLTLISQIEPAQPNIPPSAVVLTMRKPNSQRLELRSGDLVETTIVHGKKCAVIRSNLEEDISQGRPLSPEEFQRVKLSMNQQFNFFRPDFKNGETVKYAGIQQRRGIRCHKLVYGYPEGPRTVRFFSVADDTHVSTLFVKESGNLELVNVGTQLSGGIKFPLKKEYYLDGKKLHTMVYKVVEVNRTLKEGLFEVPEPKKK